MREAAGITLFNDMAVFHIHHAACRFTRHFHFVGDDDLRNAGFSQFADNTDDLGGDFWIERRRRFIKQQNLRFHHQGAGNGDTLLLAAGKMQRVAIAIGFQAQTFEQLFCAR